MRRKARTIAALDRRGSGTSRIGERLDIKDVTVNFYVGKAKKKLGVLTREQAVAKAVMLGVIDP